MRTSLLVAVAALLGALGPTYAANPPKDDAGKTILHQDDKAMAGPVSPARHNDDTTTNVIILDQDSLEALPNPYANPEPRMISDVWAMRT
jgi:hypothetical protein